MKEKLANKRSKASKEVIVSVVKTESKTRKKSASRKREDFRSRFMRNLLVKREEVEMAITRLMASQNERKGSLSADDFIDEFDQAEREISSQKSYRLLDRKNKELEKIEILIQRVQQEKECGLCEECGERIPEDRLLIVPEATRCVPCQREMEKLDSRRGLAERFGAPVEGQKGLAWENRNDFYDEGDFILGLDMDGLSLMDLEETNLEDNSGENHERKEPFLQDPPISPTRGMMAR